MTRGEAIERAIRSAREAERYVSGPGAGDTARAGTAAKIADSWARIAALLPVREGEP